MQSSKRITIVDHIDYSVDLEYNDMYAILHLPRVNKFTKEVYQGMLIKVQELWEFFSTVGYEGMFIAIDPTNKVLNKFVLRLGFKPLGTADGLSVYQYEGEK